MEFKKIVKVGDSVTTVSLVAEERARLAAEKVWAREKAQPKA